MAVLNAVVPPLASASTLVPKIPLVWSQARKSKLAFVPLSVFGTRRTRSVSRSSNAAVSVTVPIAFHVDPAFVEYSQVPLPLLSAVMATPSGALASTSVIRSPPALAMMEATVLPALLVCFSVMVVSVMLPLLSRTGASLTALTVIAKLSVSVFTPPLAVPPLSTTVHVRLLPPLASAIVLYLSPCNSASVTTVFAVI